MKNIIETWNLIEDYQCMICGSKQCQQKSCLVKQSGMKNENQCYAKYMNSQNKPKILPVILVSH